MAFRNKRTARQENLASWALHMPPLMISAALLAADWTPWPVLQQEALPYLPATHWIGLTLTVGSLAFALWARVYLGTNWSGSVQVKADHELMRSGPYR